MSDRERRIEGGMVRGETEWLSPGVDLWRPLVGTATSVRWLRRVALRRLYSGSVTGAGDDRSLEALSSRIDAGELLPDSDWGPPSLLRRGEDDLSLLAWPFV